MLYFSNDLHVPLASAKADDPMGRSSSSNFSEFLAACWKLHVHNPVNQWLPQVLPAYFLHCYFLSCVHGALLLVTQSVS